MQQAMNSNVDAGMGMSSATMDTTQKQGKGMTMGMIACAVLTVAGIGFGIYEMLQASSVKQQISDFKIEIKKDDGTTSTLETDKIEVKDDNKTIVISDSAKNENTEDYIYVGEWGVKIKIPETVKDVSYVYESSLKGGSVIYVNGHSSEDPTDYSAQPYDDSSSYSNPAGKGAVSLHELNEDCLSPTGEVTGQKYGVECGTVVNIGDKQKVISFSSPQSAWWSGVDANIKAGRLIVQEWNYEERLHWELEANKAIQNMLSDPSNYSAI